MLKVGKEFSILPFYFFLFFCLLFDIRFLKAKSLLAVDNLQQEAEQQGSHAKASEHDQRPSVVELRGVCNARIGLVEHLTNEQGEQPEADVLNPEDQRIGRTNHLGIHQLGH